MKIQRLKAQNFKSFDQLDLELGDFNVFIGANASGKSNVLNVLRFLRDITANGLRNAVSMQGDVQFLHNVNIRSKKATCVEAVFSTNIGRMRRSKRGLLGYRAQRGTYALCIGRGEETKDFVVKSDELQVFAEVVGLSEINDSIEEGEKVGDVRYVTRREGNEVSFDQFFKGDFADEEDPEAALMKRMEMGPRESLLESPLFAYPFFSLDRIFGETAVYDFDTKAQRKAAPVSGKTEIEEDGSNVALVLKNIVENEEERRRFTNLVQYVLPFVESVGVEHFAGRSLIATLEESHALGTHLPASFLSEGTIKVVALLIALYFEHRPIVAFEEPAGNLHPHLISRLIEMMREQADQKQIFVTTHSPEIIKHAGLENVYLVSRDENGFSQVTKPAEKEEVRIFLENEMGIEDLFVQDLLGI